jgi:hypothetical protein
MQRHSKTLGALAVFGLMLSVNQPAKAQNNPYPVGPIQALTGQPIPSRWTNYTVNFTATLTNTDITFAFRNDPGFTALDDVVITDLTTSTNAGLLNGGFELGTHTSGGVAGQPLDWTYDNIFGASFGGAVDPAGTSNCASLGTHSGSSNYCDGAVGSYDAIDQHIATTIGQTYQISYWLDAFDSTGTYPVPPNFQEFCNNGSSGTTCNAVDVAVYAQAGVPVAGVPEPSSVILLLTLVVGAGFALRKRIASVA